jgi:hypothetical protein
MLEKSKIEGGEIMATLAQRWLEQGEKIGLEKGKLETARELIKRGVDINIIHSHIRIHRPLFLFSNRLFPRQECQNGRLLYP